MSGSAFLSEKEPFRFILAGVSLGARASLFALEENKICCWDENDTLIPQFSSK
jgi:hypothetical protein